MAPQIRSALPTDIPAILSVFKHYVANSVVTFLIKEPSESYISVRLAESQSRGLPYIVAKDSSSTDPASQILGYASASSFRAARLGWGHNVEMTIYVHPQHTRCGIGSALMQDLLERLRRTRHIISEVDHEDESMDFPVKNVLAIVALDDESAAERGPTLRDWYIRKWGFEQVGHLKKVGYKDGKWSVSQIAA